MSEKKPRLLHPFLFAVAPILFLFAHNAHELQLLESSSIMRLLLPCTISLCLAWALCFLLQCIVFKDRLPAGVLVSLLLFAFFGFGHVQGLYLQALERLGGNVHYVIRGIPFGHYKFFLALWIAGAAAAVFGLGRWLRRHTGRLPGFTAFLNVMAATLVLLASLQIGWAAIRDNLLSAEPPAFTEFQEVRSGGGNRPDIYYIILDSYAAADTLREAYHFDNRDFLDHLAEKGFHIASKSCSNYTSTLMSVGSSLNFEHLDFLAEKLGDESTNISLPLRMVEESNAMRFLKANGYAFVNFKTPAGPAARNRHADWDVSCNRGLVSDEFLQLLVETTILEPFFRIYNAEASQERILCQLALLPRLRGNPRSRQPFFVFAHVLCPHWPYVFDRSGGRPDPQAPLEERYVNQLFFLNRLVRQMLDQLLADPSYQPIVVLQGDHGPLDHPVTTTEQMYRNRTRILNAYLLPGNGARQLYDSISPVNTFRVILNHYFGMTYPLLADRTYYSDPNDNYHYKLQDVTHIVQYEK